MVARVDLRTDAMNSGQSGSGKSSINALLMRYYDPIKGKVTFDGQDIREFKPSSWRNLIGVVPQVCNRVVYP